MISFAEGPPAPDKIYGKSIHGVLLDEIALEEFSKLPAQMPAHLFSDAGEKGLPDLEAFAQAFEGVKVADARQLNNYVVMMIALKNLKLMPNIKGHPVPASFLARLIMEDKTRKLWMELGALGYRIQGASVGFTSTPPDQVVGATWMDAACTVAFQAAQTKELPIGLVHGIASGLRIADEAPCYIQILQTTSKRMLNLVFAKSPDTGPLISYLITKYS